MAGAASQPAFDNVDIVVTSPGSHDTILPPVPSVTPPPRVPPSHSTPIKIGSSTTLPFTSNYKNRTTGRVERGKEMSKYIIGPMATEDFLNTFFPVNELVDLDTVPGFEPHCYYDTVICLKEPQAYTPFVSKHVR